MNRVLKSSMAVFGAVIGLGIAFSTPAAAHDWGWGYEGGRTRCDGDGDRCWRTVCEPYGYCRTYEFRPRWRRDYDPYWSSYWQRDRGDWYRHHRYVSGRWICDGDGDYCRWSERRF